MITYDITGRLTKDSFLKVSQNGDNVLNFSVACDRYNQNAKFFNCKFWGNRAVNLEKLLKKGMNVRCVGEPKEGVYNDKPYEILNVFQVEPIFTSKKETSDEPRPSVQHVNYDPVTANELAKSMSSMGDKFEASDFCDDLKKEFNGVEEPYMSDSDIPF